MEDEEVIVPEDEYVQRFLPIMREHSRSGVRIAMRGLKQIVATDARFTPLQRDALTEHIRTIIRIMNDNEDLPQTRPARIDHD